MTTTISILPPAELREINFSKLQAIAAIPEDERYAPAASMDLPTLGRFIHPALNCAKVLVEAYRPYVQNFLKRTAHQGKQKLLTDDSGKQVKCVEKVERGFNRAAELAEAEEKFEDAKEIVAELKGRWKSAVTTSPTVYRAARSTARLSNPSMR